MSLLETLPSEWKFLAKGNANAIFQYSGKHESFIGQLIRLRLKKEPHLYVSVQSLNDFIQKMCKPLFSGQLVETEIIEIPKEFRMQLPTFGFSLMESEIYGFLMPNVLNGNHESHKLLKYCTLHIGSAEEDTENLKKFPDSVTPLTSVILEFKPKWLYDPVSRYCRTCLLKQLKGQECHFCCIDLVRPETLERGARDLVSAVPFAIKTKLFENKFPLETLILEFAKRPNNILQKLKRYESVGAEDSILSLASQGDVLPKLSLVMTLRDVGVFLKMRRLTDEKPILLDKGDASTVQINLESFEVSSFIYDLDLKSSSRFSHWKNIEKKLQKYYNNANSAWPPCKLEK